MHTNPKDYISPAFHEQFFVKQVIFCFWGFCLSFIVLCSIIVHVKGLQSEKAQSPGQRELLFPQRTLLLHCLQHLVWSRAFTSVTYVHHFVTGVI